VPSLTTVQFWWGNSVKAEAGRAVARTAATPRVTARLRSLVTGPLDTSMRTAALKLGFVANDQARALVAEDHPKITAKITATWRANAAMGLRMLSWSIDRCRTSSSLNGAMQPSLHCAVLPTAAPPAGDRLPADCDLHRPATAGANATLRSPIVAPPAAPGWPAESSTGGRRSPGEPQGWAGNRRFGRWPALTRAATAPIAAAARAGHRCGGRRRAGCSPRGTMSVSALFDGAAVTLFDGSGSRSGASPGRTGMGSGNQRAIT
jgi:hypothetical protein